MTLVKPRLTHEARATIMSSTRDIYPAELSRAVGCDLSTVYRYIQMYNLPKCTARGKKWQRKKAETLVRMYTDGVELCIIADMFSLKEENVKKAVYYVSRLYDLKYKRNANKTRKQGSLS